MDITLSADHRAIEENVGRIAARFGDDYWTECDQAARFPHEFHKAMADAGWLGITMPVARGGGGYAAASSIHLNIFGPHAIVVHGTDEQKRRMLPPLIKGEQKACFAVTEPNAGLDTTSIETFARRTNNGYVLRGRKIWTTTAQEADKILILARTAKKEEGRKPTE